jgi:hypothetical protein
MPIATINPATAETLHTFDALTEAQLGDIVGNTPWDLDELRD